MDSKVYYEVTFSDPYTDIMTFHNLREAVKYAMDCFGFVSLHKVTQVDITNMMSDLEKLV